MPTRSPHSDCNTIAATSEATMPATIVQKRRARGEIVNPMSSTSLSKRCHERSPPIRCCAFEASTAATSARRARDSSSDGTVTYIDIRRLSERLRASMMVRTANPMRASTAITMKTIRNGETMTSSVQLRSKVPRGVTSSAGVVYVAVAGVKPTTDAFTVASRSGGRTERYVTSYSLESCWPISSKMGSRAAGLELSA
jgi:hypothetical protein